MSTTEIVLNMLAEVSTTEISKASQPQTFEENRTVAQKGGKIAGDARSAIEERTGKPVITSQNAADFQRLLSDVIEDVSVLPDPTDEQK